MIKFGVVTNKIMTEEIILYTKRFNRIRFGKEIGDWGTVKCGDCACIIGQYHRLGCDVERCPNCGRQLISCPCEFEVNGS